MTNSSNALDEAIALILNYTDEDLRGLLRRLDLAGIAPQLQEELRRRIAIEEARSR